MSKPDVISVPGGFAANLDRIVKPTGFSDFEVIEIDPGNKVVCDFCDTDYTDSKECGGLLFQSKAVCPKCEPALIRSAESYDEMRFVRGHCPEFMAFADWIRSLR